MTEIIVNKPRVLLQSLGCKTNQYENDALAAAFLKQGFVLAVAGQPVDVAVLNTCTVTAEAGRKSRQMLRRLRHHHPHAIIVVSGCHAQLTDLSSFADLTVGTSGRDRIVTEVKSMLVHKNDGPRVLINDPHEYETIAPISRPSETRAYVKIEDGCDNRCTYCAIRLARGKARSRRMENVVAEVETLSKNGHREVVLTGTHIGSYGKAESFQLIDLLEQLEACSVDRVRLGSLEPKTLTDDFVDRAGRLTKLCPHFHLSLQSGSDSVLKRMARRYDSSFYRDAVERALSVWPKLGLTTDVMVAFPGETDEEHKQSIDFLRSLPFIDFHVFRFSPREGTPAYSMPHHVSTVEARSRSREIEALAKEKRIEAIEARIGQKRAVIVEKQENGYCFGYTEDYLYVSVDLEGMIVAPGTCLNIAITGHECGHAKAKIVL